MADTFPRSAIFYDTSEKSLAARPNQSATGVGLSSHVRQHAMDIWRMTNAREGVENEIKSSIILLTGSIQAHE